MFAVLIIVISAAIHCFEALSKNTPRAEDNPEWHIKQVEVDKDTF